MIKPILPLNYSQVLQRCTHSCSIRYKYIAHSYTHVKFSATVYPCKYTEIRVNCDGMWTPFVQIHPKIIIKYVSLKNSHSFDSILQLNWKPFMRTPPLKTILAQNTAALVGIPARATGRGSRLQKIGTSRLKKCRLFRSKSDISGTTCFSQRDVIRSKI